MPKIQATRFTFTVEGSRRRSRLDEVVSERLAELLAEAPDGVSRTKVRRLISDGAVSINGRPVFTATLTVKPEDRISVFLDKERFFSEKKTGDIAMEPGELSIVYEDEWIIAVDKPAGIPTESTIVASRDSLHSALVRMLAARPGAVEAPYAGLHHRLDRETSGIILFARRKEANAAIHAAFERHEVIKTYEALCARPPNPVPAEFRASNLTGRISAKSSRAQWGEVPAGGQSTVTDFRVAAEYPLGLHMLAMPRTGRTHQIRVHLSGRGMPLFGDALYGGATTIRGEPVARVMLHAARLELRHPMNGKALRLEAPPPPDFRQCLEILRKGRA